MNVDSRKSPSDVVSHDASSESMNEINILDLVNALVSKLWIIVLAALIAAIGAYVYTANFVTPTYNSTARVYILNRQNTNSTSVSDLSSAASIKEDFLVLVKSNEISRQALTAVGEDPTQFRKLKSNISLDNNSSRFVDITVTDADPLRAKRLVDSLANVCRSRAKALMGVEDITIEEYGTIPASPSAPSMSRNVLIAAFAGIVVSAALIIVLYLLNDNISSAEDIEKKLDMCVLGSIPDASALRRIRRQHHQTAAADEKNGSDDKEQK